MLAFLTCIVLFGVPVFLLRHRTMLYARERRTDALGMILCVATLVWALVQIDYAMTGGRTRAEVVMTPLLAAIAVALACHLLLYGVVTVADCVLGPLLKRTLNAEPARSTPQRQIEWPKPPFWTLFVPLYVVRDWRQRQ